MKILVICQHYYPEPFRLTDICEELVKRGNEVTVVTGTPNYPMGKIYEGYKGKEKKDEVINGVKVHRCFEIGRRKGILFRFLNYYSFAWSSKRYVKKLKEKYDVVFTNQLSPVMMSEGAMQYKKKHGTRVVLYCLDLWPESLVAGGIKHGSLLYKYYHGVSEKIYKKADKILITSKLFKEYFKKEFNIEDSKIDYLPQYAEELFSCEACKKEDSDSIDLLFAGNIGAAQSVDTLIKAAERTLDIPNLVWHIVGDGSALEDCKKLAEEKKLTCVRFYGRKELEEMPAFYKKADAMLVSLIADPVLSLTLPGKVQTYMAAGKPIIGAINGETAEVIDVVKCGYCSGAEDVEALEKNVRAFCQDVQEKKQVVFGENARKFYEENFQKAYFFEKLNEHLLDECK